MKNAIKEQIRKIKDLDTLDEMKGFIENEINTREQVINLCNEANSVKNIRNFGFVKESMEGFSSELFKTKAGRNVIDGYINEVKGNRTLSSLHSLFEGLRKLKSKESVEGLVREWKETGRFNRKEYNSGMKKLEGIVSEAFILSGQSAKDVIDEEKVKYNNAVMSIVESGNKKGKDLGEYFNHMSVVAESISNRKDDGKENLDEIVRRFDEKFSGKLTKEGIDVVEKLSVTEDKETAYNQEKSACLAKLSEAKEKFESEGDFEASGRVELFIEGVEKKTYNTDMAEEDMMNFKELTKCFD